MSLSPGRRLLPGVVVARRLRRCSERGRSSRRLDRALGAVGRYRLARHWGVYIAAGAVVGDVVLPHPVAIVIGAGAVVEDGAMLYQQVTLGATDVGGTGYPVIRAGARIFAGATVLGSIEVGEGAIVGAGSLVLVDVPAGSVAVGSPARVTGVRTAAP